MRLYIILMLCLFAFCTLKIIKKSELLTINNFDTKNTLPLRGILAILIVLHHTLFFTKNANLFIHYAYTQFIIWGALIVGVFFFITGYGLTFSIINKGKSYLSGFFYKRIIKILIPAIIATLLFQAGEIYSGQFSFSKIISNLSQGILPLPNSWYVFAIVYFYIAFWFCFKHLSIKHAIILMWFLSLLYIFIIKYFLKFEHYWWISTFALNIGMTVAYKEPKIKEFICKKPKVGLFATFLFFLIPTTYALTNSQTELDLPLGDIPIYWTTPAVLAIIIYYMGVAKNKILDFFGKISYEIYLTHGIFMMWYSKFSQNWLLYIILTYISTIIIAYLLHKLCNQINKKLIKK